ncbi:MAG: carboxypeptidase regulatory-like domain-containing protein, partial [Phycisphaerae bacterium]|nr:carboxypeptidase regulatory-like domain-containing protein [Phycisphaerae bacterium]
MEVTVTDETDKKPLSGARIGLRGVQWYGGRTDKNGVARIRLPSGTHRLSNVSKQGYISLQMRESVEVVEGQTQRLAFQLKVQPKIRGIVLDQQGKPVSGASVCVLPGGDRGVITGEDGKFEVSARSHAWPDGQEPQIVLVARHLQQNLTAAVEVEDESKPLEVRMQPGAMLAGRVTEESGKPIPGARVTVMLNHRMWGSSIRSGQLATDAQGRYEIKAIPAGWKYRVSTKADGFGRGETIVWLFKDQARRVEVKPLVLRRANLSISGVVMDGSGKPVPDIQVSVQGQGQPYASIRTDKAGRFTINNLCKGTLRVSVFREIAGRRESGDVKASAGDRDVKIVLGRSDYSRSIRQPMSEAAAREANRKTLQRLRSIKVSPRFKEVGFGEIIQYLRDVTGVKMAVRIN